MIVEPLYLVQSFHGRSGLVGHDGIERRLISRCGRRVTIQKCTLDIQFRSGRPSKKVEPIADKLALMF
jgi:hypothetical protein